MCLRKPKAIKPNHMVLCLAMDQERKISPSLHMSHNEPYSWTSTESNCPYLIIQSIINHIA
jgi:hypothetical protein